MSRNRTLTIGKVIISGAILSMGLVALPQTAQAATVSAAPTAKTAPGQPKFGDKGAHVSAVQAAIIRNGFTLKGGVTGVFDKNTLRALKSFQKVVGLRASGVVDAPTAKVLKVSADATTTTIAPVTTTVAPTTTLPAVVYPLTVDTLPVRGAKGASVLAVQKALVTAGITVKGGVDGMFGSGTTSSLAAFQGTKGLPATGLLDASTASALGLVAPVAAPVAAPAPAPAPAPAVSAATATTSAITGKLPARGDKSDKVRVLQKALIASNVEVKGGADGVFGIATTVALQKYQTANGLQVTGTLTTPTAIKLGLVAAPAISISVFPVQGVCSYENTWHAPRGTNRIHLGVDIIAKEGNLLYAVEDGTITKMYSTATDKLAGNGVRLTRADGTYFFYGHMQRVADGIGIGVKVKAGQVLGYLGKTGGTNTPHLHLEVHPFGGEAIDPTPIVAAVDACSVTTPLPVPAP
jgi:murein DD-endopeptidase MepM/ murein hydrolase activator NlpD/Flp pilus assembly pilin Flp